MLKGIVFDLDGTLVDSLSVTFDAFNHGILAGGGRLHTPQEIMKYFGPGEDRIFAQIVGEDRAMEAYAACRQHLKERIHEVPLHAGVIHLLDVLKNREIPISIVTGRSWNTTEIILKHHAILDRFITVVANDHVPSPKPSPDGIHLAVSRMGLKAGEVFYVGDSDVDVLASRASGATAISALWDMLAKRDHLAQYDPHHFAENPGDVIQIWDQMTSDVLAHEER